MKNKLVLGEDLYYSLDCHETGLNNNVLIVGASGSGKTRGYVVPNLLEASGSYIVSDPKGNLYQMYGEYLKNQGYEVCKVDFTEPEKSAHYNFFNYIRKTQDINKMAHMLVATDKKAYKVDPFWESSAELLLEAFIAYVLEKNDKRKQNLSSVLELTDKMMMDDFSDYSTPLMDQIIKNHGRKHPRSYAVKQYNRFRVASNNTLRSIVITLNSKIAHFDTPELQKMMEYDDIDIGSTGKRKRAVFVVVSDNDRSMDALANLFFTQAMNELCYIADKQCQNQTLPVPTRFIMDDFATNCKIEDFPRMISSIRSRGISAMIMIQSEGQLAEGYGNDKQTIIGNCDSYVYLGGNDIDTAEMVSRRCDIPLKKILNMPVGTNWVFRRGQNPINGRTLSLDDYMRLLTKEKQNLQIDRS